MWGSTNGGAIPDPLAQFLGRVVPWTIANPPDAYVNIHAYGGSGTVVYKWGGRAYTDLAYDLGEIQNFVRYLTDRAEANVFFCIASMNKRGDDKGRYWQATRHQNYAHQIKALVLDLDVKPGAYATQRAVLAAVLPFCAKIGLKHGPIVSTGRGIHVYFVLDTPLGVGAWTPLAHQLVAAARAEGLLIDQGVTVDPARLLRLPTSRNFKNPKNPLECRVLDWGVDMSLSDLCRVLGPWAGSAVTPGVNKSDTNKRLDSKVFPPTYKTIPLAEVDRVWADREHNRVVTSMDLLRQACPVMADSLIRGGDGDSEPLWHVLGKLCQHVQDGREWFHKLSEQDARYDRDLTDEKYDKAARMGWPACTSVAATSPAAEAICKGCAYYGKGGSPVAYAIRGLHGVVGAAPPSMVNGVSYYGAITWTPVVVPGFFHDPVSKHIVTDPERKPVFATPVLDMKLLRDTENRHTIRFVIEQGTEGHLEEKSLLFGREVFASASTMNAALPTMGLQAGAHATVHRFIMDWTTQVNEWRQAVRTSRPGWHFRDGTIIGFNYCGKTYDANGARMTSTKSDSDYNPRGSLALWRPAANTYVGKGCHEMEVLMATSFAAPLIIFTSVEGVTVFGRSGGSGYGKTASLETGQSVWGSIKAVMRNATDNAALDKVAALNNLPVMYDEMVTGLRSDTSAKRLGDMIMNISSGDERARLGRNSQPLPKRSSRTMLAAVANKSLTQSATTGDTNALAVRVLEIIMSGAIHSVKVPDVELVKRTLEENCGRAGEVYAEFLGSHIDLVRSMVQSAVAHFNQQLGHTEADRFWVSAAATLWVGAKLSKHLHLIDFDTVSMEKFLLETVRKQRVNVVDMTQNADDPETYLDRVAAFINDHSDRLVITPNMPSGGTGRPSGGALELALNAEKIAVARELVARIAVQGKKYVDQLFKIQDVVRTKGAQQQHSRAGTGTESRWFDDKAKRHPFINVGYDGHQTASGADFFVGVRPE